MNYTVTSGKEPIFIGSNYIAAFGVFDSYMRMAIVDKYSDKTIRIYLDKILITEYKRGVNEHKNNKNQ